MLVASLGNHITKIKVFEEKFMKWIPTRLNHTFRLEPECHVFVHCHGVTCCKDFDNHFDMAQWASQPCHLRFNMKAECDSLRAKIKQREYQSDDEVEIVTVQDTRPVKCALETSPRHQSEGPAHAWPCLRINPSLSPCPQDISDR